ncbi:hypothetical protein [Corynebacterium comes]|uniref:Uncharacterized protein n=1 Tax=Corynebacterium comes TaxID=2675218 RepID=A0A6B8VVE3_9CORY|nr:hypothetical protein [Corynebacterium comes]QGU03657.1 hypothetical protein CETAM_01865 [Corynebacterium comes]
MSDKQLTVAELLARTGRDDKDGEVPRRRRRSLDEGGISVAELTGSIPAVKEKPVESKHSSVPIDGPAPEPKKPELKKDVGPAEPEQKKTPATDQTVVFGKVEAEPPTPAQEQTGEIAVVDDVEESGVEKQDVDEMEDPAEVGEKTSVTGVILLTIIGVVLGVVVFKGFEMLWENFSRPVVAVLAVLVTIGMVGVVKALRTANDGLSMFLAGLVGLVMTFGPLAVVLI